ncbi:transposase [Micromonospora sp. CP22]|nr:transposase [Micromonospora sp. CP22]
MNDNENWTGGFYELCLVLGAADDDNVDRALRSLWRVAGVQGCHVRRADGSGFAVFELGVAALHAHGRLRGALTLPSGARVVCGGFLSRYEGLDTVELYLPLGALARVDRRIGGYPFDESSGVESLTCPVDRRKPGSKHHVITDAGGIPRAVSLTGGNRHDVTQLLPPVDKVPRIKGIRGRPRQRPDRIHADLGYDFDKYRRELHTRGITPVIARRRTGHGSVLGTRRWGVEQTIALLHWFRRLRIRWGDPRQHPRSIPHPRLRHRVLAPVPGCGSGARGISPHGPA